MDFDGSGKISCQELTTTLLSTGVVKSRKEAYLMFRYADVDFSQDISLDEFLFGIISFSKARQIPLQKLEDLVEETNLLSKETLISQQRRGLLIQYVLNHSIIRDRVVDRTVNESTSLRDRRQKYRKMSSIGTISKSHEILRQKCAEAVQQIEYIVKQSASQINQSCWVKASAEKTESENILHEASMGLQPPIESVISAKLLPLINQPVWHHYADTTVDTAAELNTSGAEEADNNGSSYHANLSCVVSDDGEEEEDGKGSPIPRLSFSARKVEGRRPPRLQPLDTKIPSTQTSTSTIVPSFPSPKPSLRVTPKSSLSPLNGKKPSPHSTRLQSDFGFERASIKSAPLGPSRSKRKSA
jgi:hypothetical protein